MPLWFSFNKDVRVIKVKIIKKIARTSVSAQKDIVLKYGLSINKLDKNIKVTKSVDLKFFFKKMGWKF